MRIVIWTDKDGYKHRAYLRDIDPDHLAPSGIPDDPPDILRLDWEALKRELNNELVTRGMITWKDVEDSQNGITLSILSVFKRPLVALYRQPGPKE